MKFDMRNFDWRHFDMMNRNRQTQRYLQIGGIIFGAAAIVGVTGYWVYKLIQKRRMSKMNLEESTPTKSFAPSYRGHHKPHHRKVEANGHLHSHN